MTDRIGVAISTTGDEHRLALLMACVAGWDLVLPDNSVLFVTVDGDEAAVERVAETVKHWTDSVFRVGQPSSFNGYGTVHTLREGRLGVAANKNTGLELLMRINGLHEVEHLFLSDDDTWPLSLEALELHVSGNTSVPPLAHSMVCWGYHRLEQVGQPWAQWSWPRGAVIYTHRSVMEQVGGMIEAFGPGGHEHVEWSRRIHQAGLTPALYCSPLEYATHGSKIAMGAGLYWHAEDMPREGEGMAGYHIRKAALTSVRRENGDWEKISQLMVDLDGDTSFKPFRATENGRASATLYHNSRA